MVLFSNEFIQAISALRIEVRHVAAGGRYAEHRSRDLGSGIEFRDFRAYQPGDDVRRVDWNLYRRSGRLFLRLFEEVEDLPLHVLVDVSDSMFFETPPRADAARLAAGILVAIGLGQMDQASLYPFGSSLVEPLVRLSGKNGTHRALAYLERLRPSGPTDITAALRRFAALKVRSGLAVVISDFFDPGGIDPVLEALGGLRHRLLLVQLTRSVDHRPLIDGEIRVIDCETEEGLDVLVTSAQRVRYRAAYESFCTRLAHFARQRQATLLKIDADQPVLPQIRGLFVNGVFVA
jgi:uncharacterized protein (DUF58 family)